jgi:hypothetical protein
MAKEQGILWVNGQEKDPYIVQEMDYEISRPYDNNYKPSGTHHGGLINCTIISPNEFDRFFHRWMLGPLVKFDGHFKLPVVTGIEWLWTYVNFYDTYCIRLSEYYSNSGGEFNMFMRLTFSAARINFGNVEFLNNALTK